MGQFIPRAGAHLRTNDVIAAQHVDGGVPVFHPRSTNPRVRIGVINSSPNQRRIVLADAGATRCIQRAAVKSMARGQ